MTQAQLDSLLTTLQSRVNKLDARLNSMVKSGTTLYKLKYEVDTSKTDITKVTLRFIIMENRG